MSVKTEGEQRQTLERIFLAYFGTLVTSLNCEPESCRDAWTSRIRRRLAGSQRFAEFITPPGKLRLRSQPSCLPLLAPASE